MDKGKSQIKSNQSNLSLDEKSTFHVVKLEDDQAWPTYDIIIRSPSWHAKCANRGQPV